MKKAALAVGCVLLFAAPSYGQMMDMDKHMKEHMGETDTQDSEEEGLFTLEKEAGDVTVSVTYENPAEALAPEFSLKLDTHTLELDGYRIEDIVTLRNSRGVEYSAELLSSSGSGHHREAVLRFKEADISGGEFVELVIKDLAGVDERVFRFQLAERMME